MTKKRAFLAVAALLAFVLLASLLSRGDEQPVPAQSMDVRTDGGACTMQEPLAVCPVQ